MRAVDKHGTVWLTSFLDILLKPNHSLMSWFLNYDNRVNRGRQRMSWSFSVCFSWFSGLGMGIVSTQLGRSSAPCDLVGVTHSAAFTLWLGWVGRSKKASLAHCLTTPVLCLITQQCNPSFFNAWRLTSQSGKQKLPDLLGLERESPRMSLPLHPTG